MNHKPQKVFTSSIPFSDSHEADILFFNCCDFRFRQQVQEFLGDKKIDSIIFPGGVMLFVGEKYGHADLKTGAIYWTKAMVNLHHIKDIFLAVHQDCGAYASAPKLVGKTEKEIYDMQLVDVLEVKAILQAEIPNVKVAAYYMSLSADKLLVEFSELI